MTTETMTLPVLRRVEILYTDGKLGVYTFTPQQQQQRIRLGDDLGSVLQAMDEIARWTGVETVRLLDAETGVLVYSTNPDEQPCGKHQQHRECYDCRDKGYTTPLDRARLARRATRT